MARLTLPPPDSQQTTTLRDAAEASSWLAAQSSGQHLKMIRALLPEIRAIDASAIAPATRFAILDVLRPAVIDAEEGIEARYARKPLPLLPDEQALFASAWQLWHSLAVAYLRTMPLLPPPDMLVAMHRAAIALREALHCHYVAGIEADPGILPLLYELLVTAESRHVQRSAVVDPHLRYLGESTIAGDITWALLLHFSDPYRFSPAQFVVANRALSRWRDLANFQSQPDEDPKAKVIALAPWVGEDKIEEGGPRWLEVRQVIRKLRKRVEALEAGESPEELRLGRDLSAASAASLLRDIDHMLRQRPRQPGDAIEEHAIELVFGHQSLYALFSGKEINAAEMTTDSSNMSHERMAVFGFDVAAHRQDITRAVEVASETWAVEDRWVLRAAPAGPQVMTPTLVGVKPSNNGGEARLAILFGLRQTVDGWLAASLRILPGPVATGLQKATTPGPSQPRQPAFLLPGDEKSGAQPSICLPTGAGQREGTLLALDEAPVEHLRLRELIERGSNFIRFNYART